MRYLLDTNVCVRFLNGESELLRQRYTREFERVEDLEIEDWEVE